eukprot:TRINITY_DN3121_c0_g1_i1.p1 TRINITY_DN3121_c0_g1~~TRINITY_DN3121_c0_g1_i1.p1  ORF type:complete len:1053 (+),score=275.66 TRINITY_DN3121_c0_g1_i1:93-3161(+)
MAEPVQVFWEDDSDSGAAEAAAGSESEAEAELRVDPSDGCRYSRQEFESRYGGESQWDDSVRPRQPVRRGGERRIDPNDGGRYTKQEFVDCYGGEKEWDAAGASAPERSEPERRVDSANGRAYTRAEFVECYGGTAEWEEAAAADAAPAALPDVVEDPSSACAYCGACDAASVSRCVKTGRWFCNGAGTRPRGGPADGPSHVVTHMVLSGCNELRLHSASRLGDAELGCLHCGSTNVFRLGFLPRPADESVILLCREPCLHDCGLPEAADSDAWAPLVGEDKRLLRWLLADPRGRSAAGESHSLSVYRRLEDLWRTQPAATVSDALAVARPEREGVPYHFADGEEFREDFLPLLKLEEEEDKRLSQEQFLDGVQVSWAADGLSGTFEYYLGDGVRLLPGDTVMLRGSGAVPWTGEARVGAVESAAGQGAQKVTINTRKRAPATVRTVRVSPQWKPTTHQRMRSALTAFAKDERSCAEAVYHVLLGHGDRWSDLAASQVVAMPLGVVGLPELNHSQMSAVRAAIRQPVSLIQGPPGTGKTTTAAAVLYHIARGTGGAGGRILACAPSNIAADHLAVTAHAAGLRVLRVLSQARESDPEPSRADFLTLTSQVAALMRADEDAAYLMRVRDGGGGLCKEDGQWLERRQSEMSKHALREAEVVVTTCAAAGDTRVRQSAPFSAVLLDEATQATEPEGLIPLTLGAEKVVLIGDHCQLGPVVLSKEAATAGLSRSTFERLVLLGIAPSRLCVQYRMHPFLCKWPSGAFYDGALQNGVSVDQRPTPAGFPWPQASKPLCFCHSDSPEEVAASGTSYLNRQEANFVADAVCGLLAAGVEPESVGVVTPYEGQRAHVSGLLARRGDAPGQVEVASVDAFQGREKDVIILSCVRSNEQQGIGFVNDPKRLNVSLTRARSGVICVGNARVLSRHQLWHGFLSHCSDEGVLVSGSAAALSPWQGLSVPRHVDAPAPRAADWDLQSNLTTELPISQIDHLSATESSAPGIRRVRGRDVSDCSSLPTLMSDAHFV